MLIKNSISFNLNNITFIQLNINNIATVLDAAFANNVTRSKIVRFENKSSILITNIIVDTGTMNTIDKSKLILKQSQNDTNKQMQKLSNSFQLVPGKNCLTSKKHKMQTKEKYDVTHILYSQTATNTQTHKHTCIKK